MKRNYSTLTDKNTNENFWLIANKDINNNNVQSLAGCF